MRFFLNGQEMEFVEGGYEYVFLKPYKRCVHDKVVRSNGELYIQLYDNGVQIRTLITKEEITTLINRDIAIDHVNRKIYILEKDSKIIRHDDGSVEILK
ncbi:hypothetical protein [Thermosyntropha sp.]|uniref:hypothetical protein n=1 Tax=Thermosyntropha sp. TaxID=2740820 RepID=UPI0025FFBFC3|nr:hypothetical protein [Thermosyntropha sp.]MBO8159408.1 hypothetical protein [Thermosyntropha sp.]